MILPNTQKQTTAATIATIAAQNESNTHQKQFLRNNYYENNIGRLKHFVDGLLPDFLNILVCLFDLISGYLSLTFLPCNDMHMIDLFISFITFHISIDVTESFV